MKLRLLDLIVCPIDKSPLELIEWDSRINNLSDKDILLAEKTGIDSRLISNEVINGVLLNKIKKIYYPIDNGVPRLLTFRTKVGEIFEKKFKERLSKECPDYSLPNEKPAIGEADVLRSFSNEWVDYDWDGESYWNLTPNEMFRCMNFMLDLDNKPVQHKRVLELGIGIGGIADYVSRSQECELVGVDLGYSVDAANKHFSENKFLHIVQASAFALPFKRETFDFVYSQGVIHHTYSTKTAFDNLSKLPKKMGRLYIWVYSPFDESRSFMRRAIMSLENVLRPIIWPQPTWLQNLSLMPLIPLYMAHQKIISMKNSGQAQIQYGAREALHAARDRFTPRYIHRHDDEEVVQWFKDAGYDELQCASKRPSPPFVPTAFVACTGVDGVRKNV